MIRLAKYIGHSGYCSRKQASRHIDAGDVLVNGKPANHIDHVTEQDCITILREKITVDTQRVYYAYHKPVGIDCKLNKDDPASLSHHLPKAQRVYPIGRLDKDSKGLLILTNDGEFCNQMTHPDFSHEKEYLVRVQLKPSQQVLDDNFAQKMTGGLVINNQLTLPCQLSVLSADTFKIILTQGLNRQIRKMSHQLGYKVIDLKRIRFEQFILSDLPEGQIVQISKKQIIKL
ncbi:23S rRNA pseudouridine synthase F [Pseudoalteromonas sp. NBT06-2]|uniref:pseudouridine synthase n=1 Tax=Pseudoalteromonas sp. NBT06-2 TaxID=2025950 RepID=UPI000BA5E42A|nr:RNA pseudouridine synthase [Pseudoalteromonas sp. NBT06-2]PAJ72642.1 23S rRNA pseudouridine synthase F [Pseudoalteromonas sp. NBT06-2]